MPPAASRPAGLFVGLATLDVVYRVEHVPAADEKVVALSQELAAGGPAANAAVTYAALGGSPVLATALGAHPFAAQAHADLARHGVDVRDALPGLEEPPAVATILVTDGTGERSVVSLGASHQRVGPPEGLARLVREARVLLLDGHHPEPALAAARAARDAGVPVVLDAGSWKDVLDELLPLVDIAACSAAFRTPEAADEDATVEGLRERGVPFVAVTHGGGPVRWASPAGSGTVQPPAVEVRDTLGAGDAFHGALAFAVARGDAFPDALSFAARVASLRCGVPGQRTWLAQLAG
ncbi:PfkB family carbohydrate kinase [Motilibacter deserti]|uniref:Carbohydrate kinase PfkB domain-containing protein n=1 Tax=Motilibacter deserti TaxID=2714956 RepID=A0ABX0GXG3_9ACTN|nr:PfkB family carbohydrate kinase [Motilibacter deserti]NHC15619.1 hypothetical protein [Motilibacter deserti]